MQLEQDRHQGLAFTQLAARNHRPRLREGERPDLDALVLVRQYRHAVGESLWELPAGKLDGGEKPEDGIQRELREEIGHRAEHLEKIAFFYTTPGFCDEAMHVFRATGLVADKADADEDERIEIGTFTLAQARTMIASGELREGKTLVAILLELQRGASR